MQNSEEYLYQSRPNISAFFAINGGHILFKPWNVAHLFKAGSSSYSDSNRKKNCMKLDIGKKSLKVTVRTTYIMHHM